MNLTKNAILSAVGFFFFITTTLAQHHPSLELELPLIHAGEDIIHHAGYILSYNEKYEQANWVAYELTEEETQKVIGRTNKFLADPLVKTGSANDADYAGAGYDRGHLAPAADMGWSETTMSESFYFSNMSPQTPSFNRGIWKKLEELVRDWAQEYQHIYITTGPVFEGEMTTIGANKVAVPPYYYKVILRKTDQGYQSIGFLLPNEASSLPLDDFAVSVDSVEKRTKINFFAGLDDTWEEKTEKEICVSCWDWKISKSSRVNYTSAPKTQEEEKSFTVTSASHEESVQCHGITQKGSRCKKMTKDPSGYCGIHKKLH